MGRIREEVMRQADEMLEAVRREVRAAAADRDGRVAAVEKKGRDSIESCLLLIFLSEASLLEFWLHIQARTVFHQNMFLLNP